MIEYNAKSELKPNSAPPAYFNANLRRLYAIQVVLPIHAFNCD